MNLEGKLVELSIIGDGEDWSRALQRGEYKSKKPKFEKTVGSERRLQLVVDLIGDLDHDGDANVLNDIFDILGVDGAGEVDVNLVLIIHSFPESRVDECDGVVVILATGIIWEEDAEIGTTP